MKHALAGLAFVIAGCAAKEPNLDDILARRNAGLDASVIEAQEDFHAGNYAESLRTLEDLERFGRVHPELKADCHVELAQQYLAKRELTRADWQHAHDHFSEALAHPKYARADLFTKHGQVCMALGLYDVARQHCKRALELAPDDDLARMGYVYSALMARRDVVSCATEDHVVWNDTVSLNAYRLWAKRSAIFVPSEQMTRFFTELSELARIEWSTSTQNQSLKKKLGNSYFRETVDLRCLAAASAFGTCPDDDGYTRAVAIVAGLQSALRDDLGRPVTIDIHDILGKYTFSGKDKLFSYAE